LIGRHQKIGRIDPLRAWQRTGARVFPLQGDSGSQPSSDLRLPSFFCRADDNFELMESVKSRARE